MKTKIIYISGNEVFEMAQIRAAFDEVRSALGLDNDTILFGVPIDNDNALSVPEIADNEIVPAVAPVATAHVADTDKTIPQESEFTEAEPDPVVPVMTTIAQDVAEPEPVVVDEEKPATEPEKDTADDEKVIPILSILSVKERAENTDEVKVVANEIAELEITEPMAVATDADDTEPVAVPDTTMMENAAQPDVAIIDSTTDNAPTDGAIISGINIDTVLVAPAVAGDDDVVAAPVSIDDMIRDEAPVAPAKSTLELEDLLESMEPLREDIIVDAATIEEEDAMDEEWPQDDTDATLAQLASEFAENEDKIVNIAKTETQGKIGKLKSILPFKKRARDDGYPTDNLFGWAGVAANDEEFSIPGFFTPVSSKKKQGA